MRCSISRRAGNFLFNIETKIFPDHPELTPPPDEFARMVLAMVRKHQLEQRVMLQSFDFRTLHAMKKLAPEINASRCGRATIAVSSSIAKDAEAPHRFAEVSDW